ncbi:Uncharacterised protein [Mycobacterium tuberculosis]|uniref:Uncharacterized protein n=1 Tax=Mycobacterium tuberculosis TaxID=1773 RepID=A0A0U0RXV8_MYCTX|nr:Uncharacterised protein [Mycobacterium tuberculosis]CKP67653.1 Uncharacterised protein [Mycobacterium tuberculosis]CKT57772.1 Uncharacterised protein [Mycobacterium tuberculosis]CKX04318.1 Uncharacterised protein [Mycobacterium tuberculosis]CNW24156.1 Uncharacterised protein [Mycobacterium tuberculosis]
MAQQLFFEVAGGDGFSRTADDILDAPGDHQIAVVAAADQVAAAVEAVRIEAALVVAFGSKIAVQRVGPAHQEFAFLPGPHRLTIGVDDAQFVGRA